MTIASQLKSFHGDNLDAMMAEAEELGEVTQDYDNESTEYDFADGSVLIIGDGYVSAYGSR